MKYGEVKYASLKYSKFQSYTFTQYIRLSSLVQLSTEVCRKVESSVIMFSICQ